MSNEERQDALYDQIWNDFKELSSDTKVDLLIELFCTLEASEQDEFLRETGNP